MQISYCFWSFNCFLANLFHEILSTDSWPAQKKRHLETLLRFCMWGTLAWRHFMVNSCWTSIIVLYSSLFLSYGITAEFLCSCIWKNRLIKSTSKTGTFCVLCGQNEKMKWQIWTPSNRLVISSVRLFSCMIHVWLSVSVCISSIGWPIIRQLLITSSSYGPCRCTVPPRTSASSYRQLLVMFCYSSSSVHILRQQQLVGWEVGGN